MKNTVRRILACMLVAFMVLSVSGSVFALGSKDSRKDTGLKALTANDYDLSKVRAEKINNDIASKPVEIQGEDVIIMVKLKGDPALKKHSSYTKAAQNYAAELRQKQETEIKRIKNALGVDFKVTDRYTLLFNGFAFTGKAGLVEELNKIDGVHAFIAPEWEVPTPTLFNSADMVTAPEAWDIGYTGKGTAIAIVDTGCYVAHEAFANDPDEDTVRYTKDDIEALIEEGDLYGSNMNADTVYYSAKIPFRWNYKTNNYNVAHESSDHGTHVSGIAAGNCDEITGVAPDAQLVIMQVFSGGSASWNTIIHAMEDCAVLGVDSANLSLGSACGFTHYYDDSYAEVFENLVNAGVNISMSAGNDGSTADESYFGYALADNPEYGVVGSPSTWPEALSIASIDNSKTKGCPITYVEGELDFPYSETSGYGNANLVETFGGETLEYVYVPGAGNDEDFEGIDVEGKVALIQRGDISFYVKVDNAAAHGAVAALIFNNQAGVINMNLTGMTSGIPAVSILQMYGDILAEAETGHITIGTEEVLMDDPAGGTPSSFSSWGPTSDLRMKPQITAPGGSIYSSVDPTIEGGELYQTWSGTSMSAPHVAGGMAIVSEYVDETFPDLSVAEKQQMVDTLLMSTANPFNDAGGSYASVRKQGAGLMNLGAAVTTKAYITVANDVRPQLELGDDPDWTGLFEMTFTVHNFGDEDLTYTVQPTVLTDNIAAIDIVNNSAYLYAFKQESWDITKFCDIDAPETVTVPAGGTADVTVTVDFTADNVDYFRETYTPNGFYLEGFIELLSDTEPALSVPYLGFVGDWNKDVPVFDQGFYYEDEWESYVNGTSRWGNHPDHENFVGSRYNDAELGLGLNHYVETEDKSYYLEDRNAISPNGDGFLDTVDTYYMNLLRNCAEAGIVLLDSEGDLLEELASDEDVRKCFYYANGEIYYNMADYIALAPWEAEEYADQDICMVIYGVVDNNGAVTTEPYSMGENVFDMWQIPIFVDVDNPTAEMSEGNIVVTDNHYVAYVGVYNGTVDEEGNVTLDELVYEQGVFEEERGMDTTIEVEDLEEGMLVCVADYAGNEAVYEYTDGELVLTNAASFSHVPPVLPGFYLYGFERSYAMWAYTNTEDTYDCDVLGMEDFDVLCGALCGDTYYAVTDELYLVYIEDITASSWSAEYVMNLVLGDADGDGKLTLDDALKIMRYAMHVEEIDEENLDSCDVNGDGKINMSDALLIARYVQDVSYDFEPYAPVQVTGVEGNPTEMAYDAENEVAYLVGNGTSKFYSLDLATGEATEVCDAPYGAIAFDIYPIDGKPYFLIIDSYGYLALIDPETGADYDQLNTNYKPVSGGSFIPQCGAIIGDYFVWEFIPGNAQSETDIKIIAINIEEDLSLYNLGNPHMDYYYGFFPIDMWLTGMFGYEVEPAGPYTPPEASLDTENATFYDNFEEGIDAWEIIDADGDGFEWDVVDYGDESDHPIYQDGSAVALSNSYVNDFGAVEPDNWMISPEFKIAEGDKLAYFVGASDPDWYEEHYAVYLIPEGKTYEDTDDLILINEETLDDPDCHEMLFDLADYVGGTYSVAFRHYNVSDMFVINIDSVCVGPMAD